MSLLFGADGSRAQAAIGAALASSLWAAPAHADPCSPVRVISTTPPPDAWQHAADELVDATAAPGRPWSCPDADLILKVDVDGGGAMLRLVSTRGARERRVLTPEDLISTAKAWLSVLPPPEAAGKSEATNAPDPPKPSPSAPPPPDRAAEAPAGSAAPHAQLGAAFGMRFEAPTDAIWTTLTLRASAPFGAWSVGAWLRVAAPVDVLDPVPPRFSMYEVVLGGLLERRVDVGALTLRGAFLPAVSVVTMEGGRERNEANGEKFDVRAGLRFGASRRITSGWHLTVDGEGELAPFGLAADPGRHIQPSLPLVPSYGLGVEIGVEAWVH